MFAVGERALGHALVVSTEHYIKESFCLPRLLSALTSPPALDPVSKGHLIGGHTAADRPPTPQNRLFRRFDRTIERI